MSRFKESFIRFMQGRYGVDALGKTINIVSLILLVLALFTRFSLLYFLGIALIIYEYYRMFSRNIQKRYQENQKFLTFKYKMAIKFGKIKNIFKPRADAKAHRIYKCPSCKQKVRVPKGRGRIEITCPKCKEKFIKKT